MPPTHASTNPEENALNAMFTDMLQLNLRTTIYHSTTAHPM